MKDIPAPLLARLNQSTTTMATLFRLERQDNTVFGFTDHDQDITYTGTTYVAAQGFNRSAVSGQAALSVANMEVEGLLIAAGIDENDVRKGLYDYARVAVMLIDWENPGFGVIMLRQGTLGEIVIADGVFKTEIRGAGLALQRNFVEVYTLGCQAEFCDSRCGLNIATYTINGMVVTALNEVRRAFTFAVQSFPDNTITGGLLTWVTGNNAGLSMEIKSQNTSAISLALQMPADIQVGDVFSGTYGCNKSFQQCQIFGNHLNFRGFPDIPGADQVYQIAGYNR